ncbi:MAG: hypothetical protein ACRC46_00380 [Thermoguttaceae bacterium]
MSEEKRPLPKTAAELDAQLEERFWDEMQESPCVIGVRNVEKFEHEYFDITPRASVSPHLFAMSREAVAGIAPPALGCKPAPTRAGLPATPSPPITNRGATLYTHPVHTSEPRSTNPDVSPASQRIMGGYDGGVVVGFDGKWRSQTFESIKQLLEKAREQSQVKRGDPTIELDGFKFQMQPHGGGKGVYYRYILEAGGAQVLVHANPEGDLQPVRVRYGAEALIGQNLFTVHERFRGWLDAIGFEVEKVFPSFERAEKTRQRKQASGRAGVA